jgi:hypothetical protein
MTRSFERPPSRPYNWPRSVADREGHARASQSFSTERRGTCGPLESGAPSCAAAWSASDGLGSFPLRCARSSGETSPRFSHVLRRASGPCSSPGLSLLRKFRNDENDACPPTEAGVGRADSFDEPPRPPRRRQQCVLVRHQSASAPPPRRVASIAVTDRDPASLASIR